MVRAIDLNCTTILLENKARERNQLKKKKKISVLPLLILCFYNPDKVLEYPVNQQKKTSAIGN